ncbi:MAG: amidohydrolase family protein, partial [Pseudomonadota bacterium]
MFEADRRTLIEAMLMSGLVAAPAGAALAQSNSLTDIGAALQSSNTATIYVAKEIITMDDNNPTAEAVAVADGKILGVGSLEDMRSLLTGKQEYTIDRSMADKVVVPGFIAQHDHPLLAALTMSSDILSIEDWELPTGTVKALKDKDDFVTRLTAIVAAKTDPNETVLSWGYHEAFYGKLTRDELDAISDTQPIVIWGRSCHEFFLNSRALELSSIDEEFVSGLSESEKEQSNLPDGHFFEQGSFAILPKIAPLIVTADRFRAGLLIMRDFMHAKGITIGNEPGGVLSRAVQDGVNAVMSDASMPFRWEFMPDGKSLVSTYGDKATVMAEIEKLKSWYSGNTRMAPGSIKLFADGAIYSLLMQTRDPYLDGHAGAWMTDLELFENAFEMFWDEGFQIHIHVNGDAGLDRVLNTLEKNMERNPREDHR